MVTFKIRLSIEFSKEYVRLTARNSTLGKRIDKTLDQLKVDPFYLGLRTHKVDTKIYGEQYSSRVNGDLRIIWSFQNEKLMIHVLAIGGHSGSHKVYK